MNSPLPQQTLRAAAKSLPSRVQVAEYHDSEIRSHLGNPFLAALPPIRPEEEVLRLLAYLPPFSPADRERSREERGHLVAQIPSFYEPLPMSAVLYQRIDRLIRLGYLPRNPMDAEFPGTAGTHASEIANTPVSRRLRQRAFNSATSMTVIGISGIGKTSAIECALDLYPQVIVHSEFCGRAFPYKQAVWLHLNSPQEGSLRGLLMNLIIELDRILDTNYQHTFLRSRPTVNDLIPTVSRLASWHGLGLLVIDEIQDLKRAKSGGEDRMLNFFVQLINTVGVPMILVGTPGALPILTKEFRMARRGTGQGDLVWNRMADRGGGTSPAGDEEEVFRYFCKSLWNYQYVRNPVDLSAEHLSAIYEESAGITDIVVKLFVLAQQHAIDSGVERVTPQLIRAVASEDLQLVRGALDAISRHDLPILARLDDVMPVRPFGPVPFGSVGPEKKPRASNGTSEPQRPGSGPPRAFVAEAVSETADHSESPPALSRSTARTGPRRKRNSAPPAEGASTQTLWALAAAGRAGNRSTHDTLLESGLIRELWKEIDRPPNKGDSK